MTDEERKQNAIHLKEVMASDGGRILFRHIEEEIRDGWEAFINMPVDQKTSKASFAAQAKYIALKGIREWVISEIRLGE